MIPFSVNLREEDGKLIGIFFLLPLSSPSSWEQRRRGSLRRYLGRCVCRWLLRHLQWRGRRLSVGKHDFEWSCLCATIQVQAGEWLCELVRFLFPQVGGVLRDERNPLSWLRTERWSRWHEICWTTCIFLSGPLTNRMTSSMRSRKYLAYLYFYFFLTK